MPPASCSLRTAIISAPMQVRIDEMKAPSAGNDQVVVRLQGCGICGSNVPVWEGRPWFQYPLEPGAPGHEGWGFIHQVGTNVRELSVGDRVAVLSTHAFADYDVVSSNDVVALPGELDAVPFPAEPLACAMNVFRRSDIRAGQSIAIVGIGFLGALLVQLATNAGASVTAISRRDLALDLALGFGAKEVVQWDGSSEQPPSLRNRQFDCVIEVVGKQEALDLAVQLTTVRGRLVIAGYHQDGKRQVDMQLWNWRGLDVINAHERDPRIYRQGMKDAIDAVLSGALTPSPLYTHAYPLEDIGQAFETVRERRDGCMKTLVLA